MGIPRELQKLFKGSIELLDAQSLADASIKTGSKIKLEIEDTDPPKKARKSLHVSKSAQGIVVKATRHHEYAAVAEESVNFRRNEKKMIKFDFACACFVCVLKLCIISRQ